MEKTQTNVLWHSWRTGVYINIRSYEGDFRRRCAYSHDDGKTWTDCEKNDALIGPVCQGSVLDIDGGTVLFFCNPASEVRENLTLKLSRDNGQSWKHIIVIQEGPSGYSDLVQADDAHIGCLYEFGQEHSCQYIGFAVIEDGL